MFYSKSLEQGLVIVLNRDIKNPSRTKNDIIIKTWLTQGDDSIGKDTQKVKIESIDEEIEFVEID